MADERSIFLSCVDWCRPVLASDETGRHWDDASALPEFTVRGLAGHLFRSVVVVLEYLRAPAPDLGAQPIGPNAYYPTVVGPRERLDIHAPAHVGVRQRGESLAAVGQAGLVAQLDAARGEMADTLDREPADRILSAINGTVIRLNDFLVTRMVEILVHTDDLAVSVGLEAPVPPPDAAELAISDLVGASRIMHGDLAVLRALTRRERDTVEALRVL